MISHRADTLRLMALITLAYPLFVASYMIFVMNSFVTITLRLPSFSLSDAAFDLLVGYFLSLVPCAWITTQGRVSKTIYVFLYVSLLLPSIVFTMIEPNFGGMSRYVAVLMYLASFFVMYLCYYVPLLRIEPHRLAIQLGWLTVFLLGGLGTLYFLATDSGAFAQLSFLDVYERRLELREEYASGARARIAAYLANWMGIAIAPFLVAYGLSYRKWRYVAGGMLVALVAFAVSSHKTAFFTALIVGLFIVTLHVLRKRGSHWQSPPVVVAIVIIVFFIGGSLAIDLFILRQTAFTWVVSFRLFHNNGYLTATYIEYFSDKPLLFYADSFLRGLMQSPFQQSFSRLIGDYITRYSAGNNANANFLADGYVNLGYVGMLFAALQMGVVLWLADSFARDRDPVVAAGVLMPFGLILSNLPVHTALVSNGLLILLFLLLALPRGSPAGATAPRDRREDRHFPVPQKEITP